MREFIKSLVDSYSERIKNPLLGSFTISFIFYNWRPIFILLFSDDIIESKIQIIDTYYSNVWSLCIPLFIAIGYVAILPFLNIFIEKLLNYPKSEKFKIKNRIIDENMEIRFKQAKNEKTIADFKAGTSQINDLQNRIEALTQENNFKGNQITELIEKNNLELITLNEEHKSLTELSSKITNELEDLRIDANEMFEVNKLLSDYDTINNIHIKKYLRKNLNTDEIIGLKAAISNKIVSKTEFRYFILGLLYKGNIIVQDNHDYITVEKAEYTFIREI